MNEKLFITGVSQNIEWLLPWWLKKFNANNVENIPLTMFDFGLSEVAKDWCHKKGIHLQVPVTKCDGWFYKPTALREANGILKVWIDIDCEINGDISNLFNFIEEDKLSCGIDRYHSWGCKWQTGVVGVKGDPEVLQNWEKKCIKPEGKYDRGDQELLYDLVTDDPSVMTDFIPEKYNWLRMAFFKHTKWQRMAGRDTRIIHWTGEVGKKILTRAIRERKNTIDIVKQMV